MNHKAFLLILSLVISSFMYAPKSYAEDEMPKKIVLNPSSDRNDGRPKSPMRIPVICFYDGNNITITATTSLYGDVIISDKSTEMILTAKSGNFMPSLEIPVADLYGNLLITVIIDNNIFTGSLSKY